jgi:hypothetical protein
MIFSEKILGDYIKRELEEVKKRRQWWDNPPELPKDHEAIPDSLGVGVFEARQEDGSLAIYFYSVYGKPYVVLGKYAEPKPDGSLYYVSLRNHTWGAAMSVSYYEHLLPAVARILELKEEFDESRA